MRARGLTYARFRKSWSLEELGGIETGKHKQTNVIHRTVVRTSFIGLKKEWMEIKIETLKTQKPRDVEVPIGKI